MKAGRLIEEGLEVLAHNRVQDALACSLPLARETGTQEKGVSIR